MSQYLGYYSVQLKFSLARRVGGGVSGLFFTKIVYLCYAKAVYRVSMFYFAWNLSTSLWGGVCKPNLVFSLAKAEQFSEGSFPN